MNKKERRQKNARAVGTVLFWSIVVLFFASWYFIGFDSGILLSPGDEAKTSAIRGAVFLIILGIVGVVACAAIFYLFMRYDFKRYN